MDHLFKKIILLLLYRLSFWVRNYPDSLTVLTYHRISNEPDLDDPLKVSVGTFEKQILLLKRDYNIISGEQLEGLLRKKKPFPENACLITFDDGWQDNYTNAYPVLKKHGVPALVFLTTDYIGTNRMFWHEELKQILERLPSNAGSEILEGFRRRRAGQTVDRIETILKAKGRGRRLLINDLIIYLKNLGPSQIQEIIEELRRSIKIIEPRGTSMLSWEQVEQMSRNGFGFGSHTKSHALLTQINNQQVAKELRESKRAIENNLSKPVYFLSYPNGYYNEEIIQIAKDAGYLACFTCLPGANKKSTNSLELKRKHIREEFSLGLSGEFSEVFFKIEMANIRSCLKGWRSIEEY